MDYEKRLTSQLSDLRGKLSARQKKDAMKQVHAYQQDSEEAEARARLSR